MTPFWPRPDDAHHFRHSISAFGIFCVFLLSALGWGPRRLAIPLRLAAGTALLAWLMEFRAISQTLGPAWWAVDWAILLAGLILLGRDWQLSPGKFRPPRLAHWMVIAPVYVVLLRVLQGFRLHGHGDPLYYQLAGPADFYYRGGLGINTDYPQTLQSSSWENLYLWGMQLIAGPQGAGLTLVQCFGQWTHSLIGFGGCAALLWRLFSRWTQDPRILSIAVLASLSTQGLNWSPELAKNDWGTVFWILAGFLIWIENPDSAKDLALSGFLIGAGLIGKPIYGLAVVGVVVLFQSQIPRSPRHLTALFVGGLAGILPIAARNFSLTGNPLFPWGNALFPSALLGPSLTAAIAASGKAPLFTGGFIEALGHRLYEWLTSSPLSGLLIALWIPACVGSTQSRKEMRGWGLAFFLSLILLAAILPQTLEFRYLGPIALIASGLAVLPLNVISKTRWADPVLLIAWIWVLIFSAPPHHTFLQLLPPRTTPLESQVISQTHGDLKRWLRLNLQAGESAALVGDNEVFYLLPYRFQVTSLTPSLDRALNLAQNSAAIVAALRQSGVRYILNGTGLTDERLRIQMALLQIASDHPNAVVFHAADGDIVDLKRF